MLMTQQGAIYFEDGKQLLIDNGVSTTELTGFYSSGIDTGSYRVLFAKRGALSYVDDTAVQLSRA